MLRAQKIGVLGDFIFDELWHGETTRISPEAPVPVVLMDHEQGIHGFPGGAGNVAANIAALGGRALPFRRPSEWIQAAVNCGNSWQIGVSPAIPWSGSVTGRRRENCVLWLASTS